MLLAFLIIGYYNGQISGQNERNAYLQDQITQVDKQIKEIEELDKKKAKLLARKEVIEQLQANRSQMVHLFDSLVRTIPDGVILTSIKQEGDKLTLEGRSQSNARVSTYMRNLEGSGWMTKPDLSIIEAKGGDTGLAVRIHPEGDAGQPERAQGRGRRRRAGCAGGRSAAPAPPCHGSRARGPAPATGDAGACAAPRRARCPSSRRSRAVSQKKMSLKDLDFNNIGGWPRSSRSASACWSALLIFGLVVVAVRARQERPSSKALSARKPTCAPSSRPSRGAPPTSSR